MTENGPFYIWFEPVTCKSIKVPSAFVFVKAPWTMVPLNLLSTTPFKQHLSSQTVRKTFAFNVRQREMEEGDSLAAEQQKLGPNNR